MVMCATLEYSVALVLSLRSCTKFQTELAMAKRETPRRTMKQSSSARSCWAWSTNRPVGIIHSKKNLLLRSQTVQILEHAFSCLLQQFLALRVFGRPHETCQRRHQESRHVS